MQSTHNHCVLHLGHVLEHSPQTGRLQGPPGLCAFPGHLFSAKGPQSGPWAQHPTRMEIVLRLRPEPMLCLDPERAPDLAILGLPLSDLEPLLGAGDCPAKGKSTGGGSDGWAVASSRSSCSTN